MPRLLKLTIALLVFVLSQNSYAEKPKRDRNGNLYYEQRLEAKGSRLNIIYTTDSHGVNVEENIPRIFHIKKQTEKETDAVTINIFGGDEPMDWPWGFDKHRLSYRLWSTWDAFGVGNHDLIHWNWTYLKDLMKEEDVKFIGTNVMKKSGNYPYARYKIFKYKDSEILLVSMLTQTVNKDGRVNKEIYVEKPSVSYKKLLEQLKEEGRTFSNVFIIAHMEKNSLLGAEGLNDFIVEIDGKGIIIFGAHEHISQHTFMGAKDGVMVPVFWGKDQNREVKKISLYFSEKDKSFHYDNIYNIEINESVPKDINTQNIIAEYIRKNPIPRSYRWLEEIIFDNDAEHAFSANRSIINERPANIKDLKLTYPITALIGDAFKNQMKVSFSLLESTNIRNDIPAGQVTGMDILRAIPYMNELVFLTISGEELENLINDGLLKWDRRVFFSGLKVAYDQKKGRFKILQVYNHEKERFENFNPRKVYTGTSIDHFAEKYLIPHKKSKKGALDAYTVIDFIRSLERYNDKWELDYQNIKQNFPIINNNDGTQFPRYMSAGFENNFYLNNPTDKPKAGIQQYVSSHGVATPRIGSFENLVKHALLNGTNVIIRSEHSEELMGGSGVRESYVVNPKEVAINEQITLGLVDPKTFNSEQIIEIAISDYKRFGSVNVDLLELLLKERELIDRPGLNSYLKYLNINPNEYMQGASYSYSEYIDGSNGMVVANSSNPDVLYINIEQRTYVMENGVLKGELKTQGLVPVNSEINLIKIADFYKRVSNLPRLKSDYVPLIEFQLTEDGKIYFLQYHLTAKKTPKPNFRLTRTLEQNEFKATYVRGATGPEGVLIKTYLYPNGELVNQTGNEPLGYAMLNPTNDFWMTPLFSEINAFNEAIVRKASVLFMSTNDFNEFAVHSKRSLFLKPGVSVVIDFNSELRTYIQNMFGISELPKYSEMQEAPLIVEFRLISDGETAYVKPIRPLSVTPSWIIPQVNNNVAVTTPTSSRGEYNETEFLAKEAFESYPNPKFEEMLKNGALRGKKILIVDDHVSLAEDYKEKLEDFFAIVEVANNVQEAEQKISIMDFDLIYVDRELGFGEYASDILIFLKELNKTVPVVLHTGSFVQPELLWKNGFSGYVERDPRREQYNQFIYTPLIYIKDLNKPNTAPALTTLTREYNEAAFLATEAFESYPNPKFEEMLKNGALKGKKILIVDDDKNRIRPIQDVMRTIATTDVYIATNVKDAMRKIEKINFDLIYTDETLGFRESMLDILKFVKELKKNIPIVVYTGSFLKEEELWSQGFSGYVIKNDNDEKFDQFFYTPLIYIKDLNTANTSQAVLSINEFNEDLFLASGDLFVTTKYDERIKAGELRGKNILLVDDYVGILEAGKDVLEDSGANVETASSLEEAKEKLRNKSFDLIFTDLDMQTGQDGFKLVDFVRSEIDTNVPVILNTGNSFSGDELEELWEKGFSGYLQKNKSFDFEHASLVYMNAKNKFYRLNPSTHNEPPKPVSASTERADMQNEYANILRGVHELKIRNGNTRTEELLMMYSDLNKKAQELFRAQNIAYETAVDNFEGAGKTMLIVIKPDGEHPLNKFANFLKHFDVKLVFSQQILTEGNVAGVYYPSQKVMAISSNRVINGINNPQNCIHEMIHVFYTALWERGYESRFLGFADFNSSQLSSRNYGTNYDRYIALDEIPAYTENIAAKSRELYREYYKLYLQLLPKFMDLNELLNEVLRREPYEGRKTNLYNEIVDIIGSFTLYSGYSFTRDERLNNLITEFFNETPVYKEEFLLKLESFYNNDFSRLEPDFDISAYGNISVNKDAMDKVLRLMLSLEQHLGQQEAILNKLNTLLLSLKDAVSSEYTEIIVEGFKYFEFSSGLKVKAEPKTTNRGEFITITFELNGNKFITGKKMPLANFYIQDIQAKITEHLRMVLEFKHANKKIKTELANLPIYKSGITNDTELYNHVDYVLSTKGLWPKDILDVLKKIKELAQSMRQNYLSDIAEEVNSWGDFLRTVRPAVTTETSPVAKRQLNILQIMATEGSGVRALDAKYPELFTYDNIKNQLIDGSRNKATITAMQYLVKAENIIRVLGNNELQPLMEEINKRRTEIGLGMSIEKMKTVTRTVSGENISNMNLSNEEVLLRFRDFVIDTYRTDNSIPRELVYLIIGSQDFMYEDGLKKQLEKLSENTQLSKMDLAKNVVLDAILVAESDKIDLLIFDKMTLGRILDNSKLTLIDLENNFTYSQTQYIRKNIDFRIANRIIGGVNRMLPVLRR